MSDPRWRDSDPRPFYRDEQEPSARRRPLPRERGRDRNPGWQEPGSWAYGHDGRPARGGRPPAEEEETYGARPHWGALPGVLGVCIVVGGAAVGALVSAVSSSPPGLVLSAFVVAGTLCAVLAVRPRSVYTIIPVPALAYLVASMMTGLAVNQNGTTLTALAVGAAQWIASGFAAMIISTVIAIAVTIIRRPRNHGIRGPRRPPRATSSRATDPRSRRAPETRRAPGSRRTPDPRAGPRRDHDRTADRPAGSVATTAFPEWRHREGRNG